MLDLKSLFTEAEGSVLSYEGFEKALKDKGIKLADLSGGDYVSKQKYADDLQSRDTQIAGLNDTISQRDNDLKELQQKLSSAGTDAEKLTQVSADLTALQGRYETDTTALQKKLDAQAYEFATREFVNSKQFTSSAAKRDFSRSLLEANLKMADGKILGADDFAENYLKENADAFVTPNSVPPTDVPGGQTPPPQFVQPTQGGTNPGEANPFADAFHFSAIRPKTK